MRYCFSAEFLKVRPPDTTFGNAWESLCFDLLSAENGLTGLQRICAPDGGIDILHRPTKTAYQCKSHEHGEQGKLAAKESIKSLKTAIVNRAVIDWNCYTYATNANYTGKAIESILSEAAGFGLATDKIAFLGPEYWNELCAKHHEFVKHRFDYRVFVSEDQIHEYVKSKEKCKSKKNFQLKIQNNLTPVELNIHVAPYLTIENVVYVARKLLGVSGTSARRKQPFKQTIGELQAASGFKTPFWLKIKLLPFFWIKLLCNNKKAAAQSEAESQGASDLRETRADYQTFIELEYPFSNVEDNVEDACCVREAMAEYQAVDDETVQKIQKRIWVSARKLKNPGT